MPAFEHALLLMMCRKIQIVTFCSRSAMMNVSGLLHTQQEVGGSTSFTTEALGKTETQSTISWTDNEASEFYPLAFRTLGGHRARCMVPIDDFQCEGVNAHHHIIIHILAVYRVPGKRCCQGWGQKIEDVMGMIFKFL